MSNQDDRLDQLDYYTLLGVAREASIEEIRSAFRGFARRYHPDRFAGGEALKIERATRIYQRGSEAVQTLCDLDARRAYDAGLSRGELRLRSDARVRPEAKAAPEGAAAPARDDGPPTGEVTAFRSPSAQAFFKRARECARSGDLQAAWRALKSAIDQEPGNPILEQALMKVERQLRFR